MRAGPVLQRAVDAIVKRHGVVVPSIGRFVGSI